VAGADPRGRMRGLPAPTGCKSVRPTDCGIFRMFICKIARKIDCKLLKGVNFAPIPLILYFLRYYAG